MIMTQVDAVWLVPPLIMATGIGIGYVIRTVVSALAMVWCCHVDRPCARPKPR